MTAPNIIPPEKSAIDLIYEIYTIVKDLGNRLTLLEGRVISLQANAFSYQVEKSVSVPSVAFVEDEPEVKSIVAPAIARPIVDPLSPYLAEPNPPKSTVVEEITHIFAPENLSDDSKAIVHAHRVKVFGVFKDQLGRPIEGAAITISDEEGFTIKSTKTNKVGAWMTYLAPNFKKKYSVEFIKPGIRPQFKPIKFIPGQKEVELNIAPELRTLE
jgi:hypothetical protein